MRKSTAGDTNTAGILANAAELVYIPTERERRYKAQFWARTQDNPLFASGDLTLAAVRQVLDTEALNASWNQPGFQAWFSNRQEFRERIEYLADLALDQMEQILVNQDPKAQSARVNTIKIIAELASKFPRQAPPAGSAPSGLAAAIGGMDKAQLELLLEKNGVNARLLVSKAEVVDVHDDPDPQGS